KWKKLGSPQNLTQEAKRKGTLTRMKKALENENNRRATAMIVSMKKDNLSYRKIAENLNESGFVTSTGKKFTSSQVFTLYERFISKIECDTSSKNRKKLYFCKVTLQQINNL